MIAPRPPWRRRLSAAALLAALAAGCGESSGNPLPVIPPPPPPPTPPAPPGPPSSVGWTGTVQLGSTTLQQPVVTGYQVLLDGDVIQTYNGPATALAVGHHARIGDARGIHTLAIRITGQTVPRHTYFFQGELVSTLGTVTRNYVIPRRTKALAVGDTMSIKFLVPLDN